MVGTHTPVDTEEPAEFEHINSEQAAVAEQEQETSENALDRVMATLQEYCPARCSRGRFVRQGNSSNVAWHSLQEHCHL